MNTLIWDGIEIQITYIESYSKAYEEVYGEKLSHIKIYAQEELPITDTGFKSIFIVQSRLKDAGGIEKFILDALNEGAKSRAWQFKQESKKQLCLL